MFTERSPCLSRLRVIASLLTLFAITAAVGGCSGKASRTASSTTVSPQTPSPTTTLDPKAQVVARLQEILKVREEAFQRRDAGLLEDIYTTDCPCLQAGRAAIAELLKEHSVWKGRSVSIRVQNVSPVNQRLWFVIAIFDSRPFRIETENGKLIRQVSVEHQQYRFALARPVGSSSWLLGAATLLNGG